MTAARFCLLLCSGIQALALDNSVKITEKTGTAQTGRPFTIFRTFAQDEICDYPQPFVSGTALTPWQSDIWSRWPATATCPSGSVKSAYVSFFLTLPANGVVAVEFRDNLNPCSAGNQGACLGAALDMNGILNFNGGAWGAAMRVSPNPASTAATAVTVDARAMVTAGNWRYRLRGPVVTQIIAEDQSPARSSDFGWAENYTIKLTIGTLGGNWGSDGLAIPNGGSSHWRSLSTPFKITVDGEVISICFVDASNLYIGLTSGTSPACRSLAGRGQDGTDPNALHIWYTDGNYLRRKVSPWLTSWSNNTFTLNDASSVNLGDILQVTGKQARICDKSGNVVTYGTGAIPCGQGDSNGLRYNGADSPFTDFWPNAPALDMSRLTDFWADPQDTAYKALHAGFVLTFYAGYPAVGIDYQLFNVWNDRRLDQQYDVSFLRGNPAATTVASVSNVHHVPNTFWKYPDGPVVGLYTGQIAERKVWDGQPPRAVRYDFNLPYLRYSGVVPYDPTIQATSQIPQDIITNGYLDKNVGWDSTANAKCALETGAVVNLNTAHFGSGYRNLLDTGGRWDVGVNPYWYVSGLYTMASNLSGSDRWYEWTMGNGACAGYVPIHFWEGSSSYQFCNNGGSIARPTAVSCTGINQVANAFGHVVSIDARPNSMLPQDAFGVVNSASDRFDPVGTMSFNHVQVSNSDGMSHMAEWGFVPFLLTGDWYYEVAEYGFGAYALMATGYYPGYNLADTYMLGQMNYRYGPWGWVSGQNGARRQAWSFRTLTNAAWIPPDGSPEQQYFTKKLNTALAIREGMWNMVNGLFYEPCLVGQSCADNYSYWYMGRRRLGWGSVLGTASSPTDLAGTPSSCSFSYDPLYNLCGSTAVTPGDGGNEVRYQNGYIVRSLWMDMYFWSALGDAENKGFTQVRPVRLHAGQTLLNWLRNPAMNGFTVDGYRAPYMPCEPEGVDQLYPCASQPMPAQGNGELWHGNWAAVQKAWVPAVQSKLGFRNDNDLIGGYARIAYGAAAWLPDGVYDTPSAAAGGQIRGSGAWDWLVGNIRHQDWDGNTPHWRFMPKVRIDNLSVQAGDQAVILQASTFLGGACKLAVSATPFASSIDSSDPPAAMSGNEILHTLTGLTPATTYYYRITCGPAGGLARKSGTFTTAASGGNATTVPLQLTAPRNRNVASVRVDYGATSALGASATSACASSCSVSVPATTNRPLYYRITYLDGTSRSLAVGRVVVTIGPSS